MARARVVEKPSKTQEMHQTRDSIQDIWGQRTPYQGRWPDRVDERTLEAPEKWVQSACVLCSNDCALDIGVKEGRIVGVRGRAVDRTNKGRLGPKGLHAWIANNSTDRLTYPRIRRKGKLERATWDEAMNLIVNTTQEIKERFTSAAIGFYNTGQLFLEEYYTLGVLARGGLGTNHLDGNTRLCTATAADSLMQTFGCDGDPGSYTDFDVTDCILLVGHNLASQQTVLWMRVLDRLAGPNPPRLIVIDPRTTMTARAATVHLAPRVGTNVALLNGLINLLIEGNYIDQKYIEEHTIGFESLKAQVSTWTPERVKMVTGVPVDKIKTAAEILGNTPTLVSTVLQGVYQSHQATAAACQVNNLNLIRGMIGKSGCTVFQMNGQPTAQNTRETGCDGALPATRNWNNPKHVQELAEIWNVDPAVIPHWSPPTHAMQIFRYAEEGSIKMLWIISTNPCVSLPDLTRIRKILTSQKLFVVVQDAFDTETTELADVVLPAAIWAEKTGTYTNPDRTVHISYKAIEPPGEAKSDLDIFLDFAHLMGFKDKDGAPLIKWDDPESAFEAWKKCSKGKICDYSGMTYAKLTGGSGIQWPCNEAYPDGAERLYTDGIFNTTIDTCEQFGHDLITGASLTPEEFENLHANGRAILKSAEYEPPLEIPDKEYPFMLTTGRVVYHWHTRTKTRRSTELDNAAPDTFIQLSTEDAAQLGIYEGEWLEAESRRGRVQARARIGDIIPGHLFVPFHYGYWDNPGRPRAANELTLPDWDPASKQPYFKYAAARLNKIDEPNIKQPSMHKNTSMPEASEVAHFHGDPEKQDFGPFEKKGTMKLGLYLAMARDGEKGFSDRLLQVGKHFPLETDVVSHCKLFSAWSLTNHEMAAPLVEKYPRISEIGARGLKLALFHGTDKGGVGLLRHLQDLLTMANSNKMVWSIIVHAAEALKDEEMEENGKAALSFVEDQVLWLTTRIIDTVTQALTVPSP
jgi:ferredoxin-nitrate reductase